MYEKDLPWNWKLQDGKYFLTEFDMNFGKNYMAFYVAIYTYIHFNITISI